MTRRTRLFATIQIPGLEMHSTGVGIKWISQPSLVGLILVEFEKESLE